MKKIIISCLNLCLCLSILTACGTSQKVKKLTEEDITTYSSQMNEQPLSGDITLNGVKYSLPIKAKSLEDNGWKYNDFKDKGQALETNYYVDSIKMDDGGKQEERRIEITIYNISGSKVNFEDAMLGAITINKTSDAYENTVVLPKGITLASTYDDVIKAYGPATFDFMKNDGNSVSYEGKGSIANYGQKLKIDFDKNTKVIKSISLKNIPSK